MAVDSIALAAAVLTAYLIGSVPMGFILAKAFKGIDIRKFGSSNVGATNVFRVTGKLPGILTLLFDILKGVFSVTLLSAFFYSFTKNLDYDFFRALAGFAVIAGHVWTVFLKFKGGKGVATAIGVMAIIAPAALSVSILLWLAVFLLTNYVSAASLALGLALPVLLSLFGRPFYSVLLSVSICGLITYRHKDNIARLIKGEENKISVFKK